MIIRGFIDIILEYVKVELNLKTLIFKEMKIKEVINNQEIANRERTDFEKEMRALIKRVTKTVEKLRFKINLDLDLVDLSGYEDEGGVSRSEERGQKDIRKETEIEKSIRNKMHGNFLDIKKQVDGLHVDDHDKRLIFEYVVNAGIKQALNNLNKSQGLTDKQEKLRDKIECKLFVMDNLSAISRRIEEGEDIYSILSDLLSCYKQENKCDLDYDLICDLAEEELEKKAA